MREKERKEMREKEIARKIREREEGSHLNIRGRRGCGNCADRSTYYKINK